MRVARLFLWCALLAACSHASTPSLPSGGASSQSRPPQSGSFETIYQFADNAAGSNPVGGLLSLDGNLYGTTYFGGTKRPGDGVVYEYFPTYNTEKVLHTFIGGYYDGSKPYAGLVNVNGTLYGTTMEGGAYGDGTVFSIAPSGSGSEMVLYSFSGPPNDGKNPRASLLNLNGVLYGTTYHGGTANLGTVFSITTYGVETVLHSFTGGNQDGALPLGALVTLNGTSLYPTLYGTTSAGGPNNAGTVFEIPLATSSGGEQLIYSFQGPPDGAVPYAGLTADQYGTLYGTTWHGGASKKGTIFAIGTTTSGGENVLYSFAGGGDGKFPTAGLTLLNGTLYGATTRGGAHGKGTIYEMNPSGGETVLYSFTGGSDGYTPYNTLIAANGVLYGTTLFGGAGTGATGTVFAYIPY